MQFRIRVFLSVFALLLTSTSLSLAQTDGNQAIYLPLLQRQPEPTPAPNPTPSPSPSPIPGTPIDPNRVYSGRATYYDADGSGHCSFSPTPNDLMVGALSHTQYGEADWCGTYVEVTGPKGKAVIRIVDECPDDQCTFGHLDLSPQAFARIAEIRDGIVPITWRVVSPEISGPISYWVKEGSNEWWTAVQVRNHRNPIARFEYQTRSGEFKTIKREKYNYFVEPANMGPGPYTFRVTDIYGNVLVDSGIQLIERVEQSGRAQFPGP